VPGNATAFADVTCPASARLGLSGGVTIDSVAGGGAVAPAKVDTLESRGAGRNKWRVKLRNRNAGSAKVTVSIVCLPREVDGHPLRLSAASERTFAFDATPPAVPSTTVVCPGDGIPVAPGWEIRSGSGQISDLRPGITSRTDLKPEYGFGVHGDGTARGTVRCLPTTTTSAAGHTYTLTLRYQAQAVTARPGRTTTHDIKCPSGTYAAAPSFRASTAGLTVVGSRPVGGAWRYRITNTGKASPQTRLAAVCMSKTTTG
jgi:hypothetical protein